MSKVKGMPKATNGCNKATKEPAPLNEVRPDLSPFSNGPCLLYCPPPCDAPFSDRASPTTLTPRLSAVDQTRESSPSASDDDSSIDPEVLNMMMPLAPNTSSGVSSSSSSGGGGKNNRPSGSRRDQPGRWTTEEHLQFLKGLELYGKSWKKISSVVKTRTVVQIRTHAQKYLIKQDKAARTGYQGVVLMDGKALANNKVRHKVRRGGKGRRRQGGASGGGEGERGRAEAWMQENADACGGAGLEMAAAYRAGFPCPGV
jgi:SHAQKYF class myb-like DNA-binding protein